jgi:serine/threonine protein kinase
MKKEELRRTLGKFINSHHDLPSKRSRASVKLPSVKGQPLETGNYILGEVIGEGGFAKVRLCTRRKDGLQCVVKIFEKFKLVT